MDTVRDNILNLTYIAEFVDELDFVSAEALFRQFMERRNENGR